MAQKKLYLTISGHGVILVFSIIITVLSGQNPRVLLYAHTFSVLFRIITVRVLARRVGDTGIIGWIIRRGTREPQSWERSRPQKNSRTGKPAGIIPYITAVLTLFFMLGVLLLLGTGPGFLKREVLVPEMGIAVIIALGYWLNDLYNQRIIISTEKSVPYNLGYNDSGLVFLMAAIFISGFTLPIIINVIAWFGAGKTGAIVFVSEWIVFIALTMIRFISEVLADTKKKKGSFRKMSRGYK